MVIDSEFDQVFDEFELLGSLAFLSATVDKATLQRATDNGMDVRIAGWVPIGRQAFGHGRRIAILERWGREPGRVMLYQLGFVPDVEYLQLAITYLERLSQLIMAGGG